MAHVGFTPLKIVLIHMRTVYQRLQGWAEVSGSLLADLGALGSIFSASVCLCEVISLLPAYLPINAIRSMLLTLLYKLLAICR